MFDFQTALQSFIDSFVAFINSLLTTLFDSLASVFSGFAL